MQSIDNILTIHQLPVSAWTYAYIIPMAARPDTSYESTNTNTHTLTVVQSDHVQGIEQLPLVLMDALHVAIKHGLRIDLDITS